MGQQSKFATDSVVVDTSFVYWALHVVIECNYYNDVKLLLNTLSELELDKYNGDMLACAIRYDRQQIVEYMLQHNRFKTITVSNYDTFKTLVVNLPLDNISRLTTVLQDNISFKTRWFKLLLESAIIQDDAVTIEKLLIIDKQVVEQVQFDYGPCFIFAIHEKANNVLNLFIKYKLNTDIKDKFARSLLSCMIGYCCTSGVGNYPLISNFLLSYSHSLDFSTIVNYKDDYYVKRMMHGCYLDLLLCQPDFIMASKALSGLTINYLGIREGNELYCKRILIKFIHELKSSDIELQYYTMIMRRLVNQYLHDNNIVYQWMANIKEPISYMCYSSSTSVR